jgi:putative membrane protein
MHFRTHSATWILSGALAVAVPFCLAQGQQTQPQTQPNQGQTKPQNPNQQQNPNAMGNQAGAHPSRSMASANQRAADMLNTINKTEIDEGQDIQGHVQDPNVKQYAETLVNDHKDLQNKLEQAASQANISLNESDAMKKQSEKAEEHMNKANPTQAAHEFINGQIRDHDRAVKRLKALEPQITDPQLKSVVQDAIPILQKHASEAKKVQSQMGGGHPGSR